MKDQDGACHGGQSSPLTFVAASTGPRMPSQTIRRVIGMISGGYNGLRYGIKGRADR